MNRSKKPGIFIDMLESIMGEYITSTLGLRPNTETSYRCSFNLFIQYMFDVKGIPSAKISFEMIDASVIISFLDWLEKDRKRSVCSQTHDYMTVSCVEAIFKKYVSLAKKDNPLLFQADNYSPHSMRHTTAVAMLEAGVPLSLIQVTLGHRDIRTTQIYAEITQPSLDETLTKWNAEFWNSIKESQDDFSEASTSVEPEDNMPDFLKPKSRRKSRNKPKISKSQWFRDFRSNNNTP